MIQRIIAAIAGLFAAGGCTSSTPEVVDKPDPPSATVVLQGGFIISELESKQTSDGTLTTWRATSRDEEPFHFLLELLLAPPKGESRFAFSKRAIAREPNVDGSSFLQEVADAIEADVDAPIEAQRVDRLEFATAILGTSLSRSTGDDVVAGSFTSSTPGDWIALKLFFEDGDEYGEVFLNLNPVAGIGEFSMKDEEYGEAVVKQLAKVFLP